MSELQEYVHATAPKRTVRMPSRHVWGTVWRHLCKRIFDLGLAVLLLLIISPVLLAIAVLVSLDGGPVLFRHQRIGRGEVPFQCLKFRTMMLDADHCLDEYLRHHPQAKDEWARDQKLTVDPRITPIGHFLRRWSLDELPQIFNVIRGDMSLVGPRPVTSVELGRYKEHLSAYSSVLPGITGLWQISGRNDVSYDHRVELDAEYVRKCSLLLDLSILARTPRVILYSIGAR